MPKSDRLETLIQRVVADVIAHEVKDDLGFITVTGVKVTNELSFMYVYYSLLGDEERLKKTHDALERAKGFIKNQIALRVKMRKVPELVFRYDKAEAQGRKIDDLIRKIN